MDSAQDKKKWETIYQGKSIPEEISPAYILKTYHYLLPEKGKALDLACGLGANALFLAQQGLEAHAWDISETALEKLNQLAEENGLTVNTEAKDIVTNPPEKNSFDVIVVSHFLDRNIMPNIIAALKKDGLLFYQTFTIAKVEDSGPSSERFRLKSNELLELCKDLKIVIYHEEDLLGDTSTGFRNQALLVGQKSKYRKYFTMFALLEKPSFWRRPESSQIIFLLDAGFHQHDDIFIC